MITLGTVLRGWRQQAPLSLRDAAADIGIPHCTLARIERGEAPNRVTLAKVLLWLMGSDRKERTIDRPAANFIGDAIWASSDRLQRKIQRGS